MCVEVVWTHGRPPGRPELTGAHVHHRGTRSPSGAWSASSTGTWLAHRLADDR